jgi:membrane-associated phospholipid phosphatase
MLTPLVFDAVETALTVVGRPRRHEKCPKAGAMGEMDPEERPSPSAGNLQRRLAGLSLSLVVGLLLGVVALYVFAALAEDVAGRETQVLDGAVLAALQQYHSPTLDLVALVVSAMGEVGLVVVLGLSLLFFAWRRYWGVVLALALTTVGAELLDTALKAFFQRPRPSLVPSPVAAQVFSFPSGHAMVSVAFYLCLAYVGWRLLHGWRRVACAAVLIALIVAIGLSRLYLGVHYLTDVIAGYLAGFVWVDAVLIGVGSLFPAISPGGPAPPPDSPR